MPTPAVTILALRRFVSLTTFRRSGVGVATTVWIAREGDELLVTTPIGSGKVKRLRHDPRIELRPSSRSGRVPTGRTPVHGTVVAIVDDAAEVARLGDVFAEKYGIEYRIFLWIERRVANGQQQRVILRIRVADDAGALRG